MANYLIIKNANFTDNGFSLLSNDDKEDIVENEVAVLDWVASRSTSTGNGGVISWGTRDDRSCLLCGKSDVFACHPTLNVGDCYPIALPNGMKSVTWSFTDSTSEIGLVFINENGIRIHDSGWVAANTEKNHTPSNFDFATNYDPDGITYMVFNIKKGRPAQYDVDSLGLTVSITY